MSPGSLSVPKPSSHHPAALKPSLSFPGRPATLAPASSPTPLKAKETQSRQSQWKKIQITQLSCLGFPMLRLTSFLFMSCFDSEILDSCAEGESRAGRGLFPAASGSPEGRDVTAQSACPAQPELCTS